MSDVRAVREVLTKIDSLQDKVRIAKVDLRELKEDTIVLKTGRVQRTLSRDLMACIINAVEERIALWEIEIQKLEGRVNLK